MTTEVIDQNFEGVALCVSRKELAKLLGCGQASADKLAVAAQARIKIGKRIIINVDKIRSYLQKAAE